VTSTAHFLAESKSKPIGNDSEIFKSIEEIYGSIFMSDISVPARNVMKV
jgi:hypothetical protein